MGFDPDPDPSNENRSEGCSQVMKKYGETNTGNVTVPESGSAVAPLAACAALFVVVRKKRKRIWRDIRD